MYVSFTLNIRHSFCKTTKQDFLIPSSYDTFCDLFSPFKPDLIWCLPKLKSEIQFFKDRKKKVVTFGFKFWIP